MEVPIILLTEQEKEMIYKQIQKRQPVNKCLGCPLAFILYGHTHCYKDIKEINQTLSDFWNFKIDYNKIYSEE